MTDLSANRLRELLDYDPSTGVFTWKVRAAKRMRVGDIAGGINGEGYRYIKVFGKSQKANRLAWLYVHGEWPSGVVDHINGDKSDDRISNLRDCSVAENAQNRRRPKGFYKIPDRAGYCSVITVLGKRHYLGGFKTMDLAREAYAAAKAVIHPFQDAGNLG